MQQYQLSKRFRRRCLSVSGVVSILTCASITLTNDSSCHAKSYHRYSDNNSRQGLQGNTFLRYPEETVAHRFSRQAAGVCTLDQNGFYGTVNTSSNIYEVQYLYQVSVVAGTTTTQLNDEIIQPLDDAITTAVLQQFFVCSGRRRSLQSSTVTAISSMPVDTYILSGLTCAKIVANTDCYVVQGFSTVIGSGYSDASMESLFKNAVQVAIQGNTIVGSLNTTLVVDVSSLTDTLETAPPITVPPQASVPSAPSSPVPVPFSTITFAPFPQPVGLPPSFATPILLSPNSSDAPSLTPTTVRRTPAPTFPRPSPSNKDDPSRSTKNNDSSGLDWWSWLLIGGAVVAALVCGYTVLKTRTETSSSDVALPPTKRRGRDTTPKKGDAPDTEDDEPLYEPPPTITPYFAPKPDFSVVTPAPVVIPPVPDAPKPAPAFVLDAQDDNEEEEEEEDDEDYTEEEEEEEEEDMEAGEDVHHDEGEVFEDEESYYEEEDETDEDGGFEGGDANVAWGNHQQPTFGGLY